MNAKIWKEVENLIHQGQLETAIENLESQLASCKSERFKSLLKKDFTTDPLVVASKINDFITLCEESFDVQAIFLEMNGFDINTDIWFFEFFAYDEYEEDEEDLDWLSDWASEAVPAVALTGLEEAQQDFDWYSNRSGNRNALAKKAWDYAVLLVMCKFAWLIGRAVATGEIKKAVPILATAHEFDIIAKFLPD